MRKAKSKQAAPRDGDDANLTEIQVAEEFNFTLSWLRKKRVGGAAHTGDAGPPYYRFGDRVLYRRGDVRAYQESRKVDRANVTCVPPRGRRTSRDGART